MRGGDAEVDRHRVGIPCSFLDDPVGDVVVHDAVGDDLGDDDFLLNGVSAGELRQLPAGLAGRLLVDRLAVRLANRVDQLGSEQEDVEGVEQDAPAFVRSSLSRTRALPPLLLSGAGRCSTESTIIVKSSVSSFEGSRRTCP